MKKIIVLYSGGLDSFIMYHMAKIQNPDAEIIAMYFKHGADAEKEELKRLPSHVVIKELAWLNETVRPLKKSSMPQHDAFFIPGRNLVFTVLAACIDLPDEIWLGAMADENNFLATDKNEKFRLDTTALLSYVLGACTPNGVKLKFPFVEQDMNKHRAIEWALANGITAAQLASTTSCWFNNEDGPCGECIQCMKRFLTFSSFGITEKYRTHPLESKKQLGVMSKFLTTPPVTEDDENIVAMIKSALPEEMINDLVRKTV